MTVAELRQRMSLREFNQWYELYHSDPFGELREDMRAAHLAWIIVSCHSTKHSLTPNDFMLKFEKRREMTDEEIEYQCRKANALLGGKVKR